MTNIFAEPFVLAPLAPLTQAPASSAPSGGPGLGAEIRNDWSTRKRDIEAGVRVARRSAVERARHSVEAGWSRPGQVSKQERLRAPTSKGLRDAGSPKERNATKSIVAKATAAVQNVPSDTDISNAEFRQVRARLRQAYPGAKLSDLLTEAAKLEQMLIDDPVNAHAVLFAAYSRTKPAKEYVEREHAHGLRGSIQRATQDQQDSEDLAAWIAKFGKRLPGILAEILETDTALRANPNFAAAQLAARHGAPILDHEHAAYQRKQAAKQAYSNIYAGVNAAIAHGIISGDGGDLDLMGDVLMHPNFPWAEHRKRGEHANLYALRHAHEVVQQIRRGKAAAPARGSDAGSKSISGAPGAGHVSPRGTDGVRASVNRAMGQ